MYDQQNTIEFRRSIRKCFRC